jgi:WD40 repeat protein
VLLDSSLAPHGDSASQIAFSIVSFERQVRAACEDRELLLIFDHFEDIVVLFDGVESEEARERVIWMLIGFLCEDSLRVKLLLVFREDYLGRITELLAACPDRFLSSLPLRTPKAEALERVIRGPFEHYPGHYDPELTPSLAQALLSLLAERFEAGDVSLSEIQTVCLRLWQSEKPQVLLVSRELKGILEDYLNEELDEMAPEMRETAIMLLSEMVTPACTRNVISGEDLAARISVDNDISPTLISQTLEQLDQRSRLVRCERRRELRLYEITSEFLVPWISERREQLGRQREDRREQRRRRLLWRTTMGAMLLSAILAALTVWALAQRSTARRAEMASHREAVAATSLALLSVSQEELDVRPEVSLLLALDAYTMNLIGQARNVLIAALEEAQRDGVVGFLHGATTAVSSLAFSSNGQVLVAGTYDGAVKLWNVERRKQIAVLSAGTSRVIKIAFAPGGQSFATGDEDGAIRLWDARTYRQLGSSIDTHDQVLEDIAFSPNGRILAAGGLDGPLSMWSVATHKQIGAIATRVGSVAFSPYGQILAAGDYKRMVRLWSVRTRRELGRPLTTFTNQVTEVDFSPDGRTLATLTTELFRQGQIQLWNVANHRQLGAAIGGHKEISGFAFGRNGRTLAVAGNGGTTLWSVATDREIGQPLHAANHVAIVAFSPDESTLASSEGDLIEITPTIPIRSREVLGGTGTTLLAFSGQGRTLVSAGANGQVRRWDTVTHAQLGTALHVPPMVAHCTVLNPDGDILASEDHAGKIRLWNLVSGRLLGGVSTGPTLAEGQNETDSADCGQRLSLNPSGQLLAVISGEAGEGVQLWNIPTLSLVGRLTDRGETFTKVAFSPRGDTLVAVSMKLYSSQSRSRIQVWNAKSRRLGQSVAVEGEIGQITSGPGGHPVAFVHVTREYAGVGGVLLWNVGASKQLGQLPLAQGESVADVALSPDGQTLASVSGEAGGSEEAAGEVRLWDPTTRKQFGLRLTEAPESVRSVVFSPGGTSLAFLIEGGAIRLWQGILWANLPELRAKVCGLVGEGVTRSEWAGLLPGIPYNRIC